MVINHLPEKLTETGDILQLSVKLTNMAFSHQLMFTDGSNEVWLGMVLSCALHFKKIDLYLSIGL